MADLKMTKHAFGSKENIETAKAAGTIDAYDVLHLSNGKCLMENPFHSQ